MYVNGLTQLQIESETSDFIPLTLSQRDGPNSQETV